MTAIRSLEGQRPTIGRIVFYALTGQDVELINQRRGEILGPRGNRVYEGDVYPLVIARVWGDTPDSAVNGQVFLDGNDTHWVTSVTLGEGPGHYAWPQRV